MKNLRGRNAIVTGGSRGLGPYIARNLADEGVNIALSARSAELLETVARELSGKGARVIAVPADITVGADRKALVQRAEAELGQVDVLINNAGILHVAEFARQEESEVARTIETNLTGPMLLTREVLPGMLRRASGHVVNISSLAGKRGVPYEAAYAASKAGLIEWSNALRMELEDTGVDVSVLCPVYVSDTGMFAVHGLPAPRLAGSVSAEQVAKAVVRALRTNPQEMLVRPGPTRPLYAMNALWPGFGSRLLKLMGVKDLQRRLVDEQDAASASTSRQE